METLTYTKDNYQKLRASYQEGADAQSYFKLVENFGVKFFPRIPQEIIDSSELCKKLIALDSYALMLMPPKRQTEEYLFCVEKNHDILFMGVLAKKVTANVISWALDITPSVVRLTFFNDIQPALYACDDRVKKQLCEKLVLNMLIKDRDVPTYLNSYAEPFKGKSTSELEGVRESMRLYQQLEATIPMKKLKIKEPKVKV